MKRRRAQKTNQTIMRGVIAMALVVLLVCYLFLTMMSCTSSGPTFRVEGTVSDAADSTLVLEALTLSGFEQKRVAVEKNGDIVPRETYGDIVLLDGDSVEVVCFFGGG